MSKNSIALRRIRPAQPALAFWAVLVFTGLARADDTYPRTYLDSSGLPPASPDPLLSCANLTSEYAHASYDILRAVFTSGAANLIREVSGAQICPRGDGGEIKMMGLYLPGILR